MLSWPAHVELPGGGVAQHDEIQPGSFLGHFEHFSFFGHVELLMRILLRLNDRILEGDLNSLTYLFVL